MPTGSKEELPDSQFKLHVFDIDSQKKWQLPILHKSCLQNGLQKQKPAPKLSLGGWQRDKKSFLERAGANLAALPH